MRTPHKVSPLDPLDAQPEFERGLVGPVAVHPTPRAGPERELLALPARLIPDLPAPLTLWLDLEGAPARVQLTTRAVAAASCSLADVIVFDREEVRALFVAVQADRIWRKDLLGLCFDKWRKPEHRVTPAQVLAGANPDAQDWSLARVLARLGATLARFELDGLVDARGARELSVAA